MGRRRAAAGFPYLLGAFVRDRRGNVAIMGAVFLIVAIGLVAIVVDLGNIYVTKRRVQGVTDLAALVAARHLGVAAAAAERTVRGNGVEPTGPLAVVIGAYRADLALDQRFVAHATPANAVKVTVPSQAPVYFGHALTGQRTAGFVTEAIAATSETAAFSVGSRLVGLEGGVANRLLSALLGTQVALTAMDYNALASADVDLFAFLDALAVDADLTAGTYADILAADATLGDAVMAMAGVAEGGSGAADILARIGRQGTLAGLSLPLDRLIDLGPYAALGVGEATGLTGKLAAGTLFHSMVGAANAGRQATVDLGGAVPGLLSLSATVAIGEPPQGTSYLAVGARGTTIYTAQTRVRLDVGIGGSGLIGAARINVPVLADLASASARLDGIACGGDPAADARVTIAARPGAADVWLGRPAQASGWTDFSRAPNVVAADLVNVAGLVKVAGRAHVAVAATHEATLTFTQDDIAAGRARSASTTTPVASLLAGLLDDTELSVTPLGLGLIPLGGVGNLVGNLVAPVGPLLDPVLAGLLAALGVRIGEADVWVNGVRCDGAVLVR